MKASSRASILVALTVGSLLSLSITSISYATGLDDGYPPGAAAPGRTCAPSDVGQKTTSSFTGKVLACILIQDTARWWIDGDPLPPIETPAASAPSSGPSSGSKSAPPPVAASNFTWSKDVNISKLKASKFITIAGARPVQVFIPGTLKSKVPAPLLVALHGFTASTSDLMTLMNLTPEAYKRGVVLAVPSGTRNVDGLSFWNATGSCCDFNASGVDDSAYLMDLVKQIGTKVSIDPKRIYFLGHSNGGFMSYTVACNNSAQIAAIVNLEGSTFADPTQCKADHPVSVLQINGTADELININGGNVFGDPTHPYPSVKDETRNWAGINGCSTSTPLIKAKGTFDYEPSLAGAETSKESYKCPKGIAIEMWTISGGVHVPKLNSAYISAVFDFLLSHKK